jgi:23S rRNA (cytosine1962-C5)-methyltransferase
MLDPPAFTKSRENIQKAVSGYKEINLRGIKMVKKGGFLVTASCTNLVSPDLFLQTIDMAAKDAKRRLRQVEFRSHGRSSNYKRNGKYTSFEIFDCTGNIINTK